MLLTILLRRVQQLHCKALACSPGSFLPGCWILSDRQGCLRNEKRKGHLRSKKCGEKEARLVEDPTVWGLCVDPTVWGPDCVRTRCEGTREPPQRRDTHSDPTHKDISYFPLRWFKTHLYRLLEYPVGSIHWLIFVGFYTFQDFLSKLLSWGMWYYETWNITINLMSYFLWNRAKGS